VRRAYALAPSITPLLSAKARYITAPIVSYTVEYYLAELTRMIRNVYAGNLGGDFITIMASLIQGQLTQAYNQAWQGDGNDLPLPEFLLTALEEMILGQFDHVDQFFRDIVDARLAGTPIDPLLARAPLWANRWLEAYNEAIRLMQAELGGNMVWRLGNTEQHCETCFALNGIVAHAATWEQLHVHPQGAPNDLLTCGGWRCDCSLEATDQRQSPKAMDSIMNAVMK
jgi:hypothetical protein